MTQKLNAPYKADFDVSFSLTASQSTSTYSVGTWYPQGNSGLSYTTFQVPSGLQYAVVNYKLQTALTTDLGLSYILNGYMQSTLSKANFFNVSLQNVEKLNTPIVAEATNTISFIAYPTSTVTTAATETVTYSIVVSPV